MEPFARGDQSLSRACGRRDTPLTNQHMGRDGGENMASPTANVRDRGAMPAGKRSREDG